MRGYQLIKKIQDGEINDCKVWYGYIKPYMHYIEVIDKMLVWESQKFNTRYLADWQMNFEVDVPILTDKEREYLANVIKPFRNKVEYIKKETYSLYGDFPEYIAIKVRNNPNGLFLPVFENGTMYKRMKANMAYTLEELKLYDELPF